MDITPFFQTFPITRPYYTGVNYIPVFDPATEDPLDLPYDPSSIWYTGQKTFDAPLTNAVDRKSDVLLEKLERSDIKAHKEKKSLDRTIPENSDADIPVASENRTLYLDNSLLDKHASLFHQLEENRKKKIEKTDKKESNADLVFIKQERKPGVFLRPKLDPTQDFLVNHAQLNSIDQGMWFLPFRIQISIFFLLSGLVASIFCGRKKHARPYYTTRRTGMKVV
jgi:hypothetical protein